jgi:carboxymethylenebutenolidase
MARPQPDGFLATPAGGRGRGVLVLHPWWGLNENMKNLCRRLAAEGYVAFAPDLYHGKVADTIEGADELSSSLFAASEKAMADVAEAAAFLSERAEPDGLGVIGFSMGVAYAMPLSVQQPARVRAVVLFYGAGVEDFGASKASYLGHFAEMGKYESPEYIAEMEAALRAAGRPVTFHTYPGTGHWFFEPDRVDAYDEKAAALAWERTIAFLKKELPAPARIAE